MYVINQSLATCNYVHKNLIRITQHNSITGPHLQRVPNKCAQSMLARGQQSTSSINSVILLHMLDQRVWFLQLNPHCQQSDVLFCAWNLKQPQKPAMFASLNTRMYAVPLELAVSNQQQLKCNIKFDLLTRNPYSVWSMIRIWQQWFNETHLQQRTHTNRWHTIFNQIWILIEPLLSCDGKYPSYFSSPWCLCFTGLNLLPSASWSHLKCNLARNTSNTPVLSTTTVSVCTTLNLHTFWTRHYCTIIHFVPGEVRDKWQIIIITPTAAYRWQAKVFIESE